MPECVVTGRHLPCPTCNAPVIDPFPDEWTLQIRQTKTRGTLLTPHRDNCAAPTAGAVWGPNLRAESVVIRWQRWP